VKTSRLPTAEFLITVGGADINHTDNRGETPITMAKKMGKKGEAMVEMLQRCGGGYYGNGYID